MLFVCLVRCQWFLFSDQKKCWAVGFFFLLLNLFPEKNKLSSYICSVQLATEVITGLKNPTCEPWWQPYITSGTDSDIIWEAGSCHPSKTYYLKSLFPKRGKLICSIHWSLMFIKIGLWTVSMCLIFDLQKIPGSFELFMLGVWWVLRFSHGTVEYQESLFKWFQFRWSKWTR